MHLDEVLVVGVSTPTPLRGVHASRRRGRGAWRAWRGCRRPSCPVQGAHRGRAPHAHVRRPRARRCGARSSEDQGSLRMRASTTRLKLVVVERLSQVGVGARLQGWDPLLGSVDRTEHEWVVRPVGSLNGSWSDAGLPPGRSRMTRSGRKLATSKSRSAQSAQPRGVTARARADGARVEHESPAAPRYAVVDPLPPSPILKSGVAATPQDTGVRHGDLDV